MIINEIWIDEKIIKKWTDNRVLSITRSVKMMEFVSQVYKRIAIKSFGVFHHERGFTHIQLLEYFLLVLMFLGLMTIFTLEIRVIYTDLWAKINIDSFR